MDIDEKLYQALSSIGIDVEFNTYTGKSKQYITYFELLEKQDASSEDVDEILGHYFQIDIFSDVDPTEIKKAVIKKIKEANFYGITVQDLYERETKTFHKAIGCYYAEYIQEKE